MFNNELCASKVAQSLSLKLLLLLDPKASKLAPKLVSMLDLVQVLDQRQQKDNVEDTFFFILNYFATKKKPSLHDKPEVFCTTLFFFRYLDFPSLIALSSSHPSLAWLWPDFYDFTVSRNMLKAKDAADVVLMNNFLADFPVEEVNSCNILYTCIRNVPNKINPLKIGTLSHCLWAGEAGGDLEGRGDQTEATQRQASVQGGF